MSVSLTSRAFYERRGYKIIRPARIDVGIKQVLRYWEGIKILVEEKCSQNRGPTLITQRVLPPNVRNENKHVIREVHDQQDIKELDNLLWEVLWRPLGLPRDIRQSFHIDGHIRQFMEISQTDLNGGLVVRIANSEEFEIVHLAVKTGSQRLGTGRRLVEHVVDIARQEGFSCIRVIARNTSAGFFRKMGFKKLPQIIPNHPDFLKHGITFLLMEKTIRQ